METTPVFPNQSYIPRSTHGHLVDAAANNSQNGAGEHHHSKDSNNNNTSKSPNAAAAAAAPAAIPAEFSKAYFDLFKAQALLQQHKLQQSLNAARLGSAHETSESTKGDSAEPGELVAAKRSQSLFMAGAENLHKIHHCQQSPCQQHENFAPIRSASLSFAFSNDTANSSSANNSSASSSTNSIAHQTSNQVMSKHAKILAYHSGGGGGGQHRAGGNAAESGTAETEQSRRTQRSSINDGSCSPHRTSPRPSTESDAHHQRRLLDQQMNHLSHLNQQQQQQQLLQRPHVTFPVSNKQYHESVSASSSPPKADSINRYFYGSLNSSLDYSKSRQSQSMSTYSRSVMCTSKPMLHHHNPNSYHNNKNSNNNNNNNNNNNTNANTSGTNGSHFKNFNTHPYENYSHHSAHHLHHKSNVHDPQHQQSMRPIQPHMSLSHTSLHTSTMSPQQPRRSMPMHGVDMQQQQQQQQATRRPKSTFPFGRCKVCNDKATGVHYGIATCEGCKVTINPHFYQRVHLHI
jgi:hypothetical protein